MKISRVDSLKNLMSVLRGIVHDCSLAIRRPYSSESVRADFGVYLPISVLLVFGVLFFSGCSRFSAKTPPLKPVEIKAETAPEQEEEEKGNVQEAYKYFAFALLKISDGRYEEARAYLSKAIENDPESLYLHKKMALFLKSLKEYEEALTYALKCVTLDPENATGFLLLGDLYSLLGDDDLAMEQYEKASGFKPDNQRVKLLIITIQIKKGQYEEALENLKKLIEQNPDHVMAHYYRGRVYLERKQYKEAEESFIAAIKFDRGFEPAYFDLGMLYQKTKRYEDAIKFNEKLLELTPGNLATLKRLVDLCYRLDQEEKAEHYMQEIRDHYAMDDPRRQSLGLIYLQHGDLDKAIEELNIIISIWPEDDKARYYLAIAHEEKEDYETAHKHFGMIGPESEYFADARMHIAYMFGKQKRVEEAIAILKEASALRKENVDIYLMLASIYEIESQYDKSIEVVKEGLKHNENNEDLIFQLGVYFEKTGDTESCIKQMKRVLEINPNHADSLNYIGYTYAEMKTNLDEALQMIKKALSLKPDSGYITDSLGWVYFQKGQYDQAVHYLEKAVKLTSDDPTINEHLGDAYFKNKAYQKALLYYQKALSPNHPDADKLNEKIRGVEERLIQKK